MRQCAPELSWELTGFACALPLVKGRLLGLEEDQPLLSPRRKPTRHNFVLIPEVNVGWVVGAPGGMEGPSVAAARGHTVKLSLGPKDLESWCWGQGVHPHLAGVSS